MDNRRGSVPGTCKNCESAFLFKKIINKIGSKFQAIRPRFINYQLMNNKDNNTPLRKYNCLFPLINILEISSTNISENVFIKVIQLSKIAILRMTLWPLGKQFVPNVNMIKIWDRVDVNSFVLLQRRSGQNSAI